MTTFPVIAHVGLGSNLGDRATLLRVAGERLDATPGVRVTRISRTCQTAAVDAPAGSPSFLNAVASVASTLPAEELLDAMLKIEADLGRCRDVQWNEPRPIDLDLLSFGLVRIFNPPGLIVPHPRLHRRPFAIGLLAEIDPTWWHPVLQQSAAALAGRLPRLKA
jgi:2-amino-4-hydroxy-6-hydroxymethyldihydropteridine diphosphokinase